MNARHSRLLSRRHRERLKEARAYLRIIRAWPQRPPAPEGWSSLDPEERDAITHQIKTMLASHRHLTLVKATATVKLLVCCAPVKLLVCCFPFWT